jgi:dynein heavy chain
MIFLDIDELGWKPIMKSWIDTKKELGDDYVENLQDIVLRYVDKILTAKRLNCKELVASSESACVRNATTLFDALSGEYKQGETSREDFLFYVEKWFVFALIWSVGATVDEQSRRELDVIIRDIEPMFPTTNTVFEYYINLEKRDWAPWEEKLKPQSFTGKEFHEIYIQTVDWARNRYVSMALLDVRQQVLLVGQSGVGKTVLVEGMLREQDPLTLTFTVNFSAGTLSKGCQEIIESNYDRRAKNKFKPKNSKIKAVCFIDDMNMPRADTYGFQPPIELLRQWIDYGYWYDKQKVVKN